MGRGVLAVDIGNTNIVLGAYDGERLLEHWRISSIFGRTSDEFGTLFLQLFAAKGLDPGSIKDCVFCSVVPPLVPTFQDAMREYFGLSPLAVGGETDTGMKIRYDSPREVGADRIVNAVAAYRKYGGPAVVVDFGTATTFDAISAQGEYLGGAIAPGIQASVEALVSKTAKLERVEIARPESVIGKNTAASMQSGIVFGVAGQVDEIVRRMKLELGARTAVIATGGWAELISPETTMVQKVDMFLTLDGLRMILERNRPM